MKKNLILLSLLAMANSTLFSQSTFFKHFPYGNPSSQNQGFGLAEQANGNYVVLFRFWDNQSQGIDFGFYTLNANGDLLNTKVYSKPGDDYTEKFLIDDDGSYKIAGISGIVDSNISIDRKLFYSIYPNDSSRNKYIIYSNALGNTFARNILKDGNNFLLTGTKSISQKGLDVNILKIDSQGLIIFDSSYGGQYDDASLTSIIDHQGNYVLAGQSLSYSKYYFQTFLVKVNKQGQELWHTQISIAGDSLNRCSSVAWGITQGNNGNYYLAATNRSECDTVPETSYKFASLLICVDSMGNHLWTRQDRFFIDFVDQGVTYYAEQTADKIIETKDHNLVVGGTMLKIISLNNGETQSQVLIAKFDLLGNLIWKRNIGANDKHETFLNMIGTSDGGILITGRYASPSNPFNNVETFVLKTDACGCLIPGCDPNCVALGIANEPSSKPFVLYPNPTNSVLFLQSEVPIVGYQIYSMLGELLKKGQPLDNSISVEDLPTAVYTLQVITEEGNSVFKKFVKN